MLEMPGPGDHPEGVRYRSQTEAGVHVAGPDDIAGFGTHDEHYVAATVALPSAEGEVAPRRLFLRKLTEGGVELYDYAITGTPYYLFRLAPDVFVLLRGGSTVSADGTAKPDLTFRYQLAAEFDCSADIQKLIRETDYSQKSLQRLFLAYNTCIGADAKLVSVRNRKVVHFSAMAGMEWRKFTYYNQTRYQNQPYAMPVATGSYLAVGAELPLPVLDNRLSILSGLTFRRVETESVWQYGEGDWMNVNFKLVHPTVGVPIGLRYALSPRQRRVAPFLTVAGFWEIPLEAARLERDEEVDVPAHSIGSNIGLGLRAGRHFEVAATYAHGYDIMMNHNITTVIERMARLSVHYRL